MTSYEVYATRWDDTHIVETLLPAKGLSFTLPVCDDGEASFTATVEPGRSDWRAAVGLPLSGILIARDGVPWWSGRLNPERQVGPRTFQFAAKEWGSFFQDCLAPRSDYLLTPSHDAVRDLIAAAQAVPGQDVKVTTRPSTGAALAGLQVQAWDTMTVAEAVRAIADADGGPEWYVGTSGTLEAPVRALVLGEPVGDQDVPDGAVLQYVENTADWAPSSGDPGIALLGNLFPFGTAVQELPRRGGNVLAVARERDLSRSATRVVAIGDGTDAAQLRREAPATTLLAQGWPLMTKVVQHGAVGDPDTLQRLATADLAAMTGIATRYSLTSLDGDPDWTLIPRGSKMRVVLDTDVYAGPRPYTFESRLLNTRIDVADDGPAQVTWELAETMEAR